MRARPGKRVRVVRAVPLLSVLLLYGCPDRNTPVPAPAPVPKVDVFSSFDDFNDALAKRVTQRITSDPIPDFLVVAVQGGSYPVGTLLRQSQMIPVSAAACQPPSGDREVMSTSAPTLFPSYSLNRKVAGSMGLGEAVFQGMATAGFSAAQDSTVNLSIGDTTLDVWSDTGMMTVLESDACRKALKSGYRLVRGLVRGRREFSFGVSRTANANATVKNIANFQIDLSGGGSVVKVADAKAEEFVMVLSEVMLPASPAADIALTTPTVAAPTQSRHQIYVQQDSADSPALGKRFVQLLSDLKFDVSPLVERVPTSRMPSSPQVRYFHAEDESKAAQVLSTLKQDYPGAVLTPLRVPAPAGQLEVWLPRK